VGYMKCTHRVLRNEHSRKTSISGASLSSLVSGAEHSLALRDTAFTCVGSPEHKNTCLIKAILRARSLLGMQGSPCAATIWLVAPADLSGAQFYSVLFRGLNAGYFSHKII
jgi:hypothetical protein